MPHRRKKAPRAALLLAAALLQPAVGEAKILFTGYGNFQMTPHQSTRIYGDAPALGERIAALAQPAGVELRKARVESSSRIVPVLQDIFPRVDAVWILGDPIVSHDLRPPLRGIAGFSQIVLEDSAASLDDEGNFNS